MRKYIWITMLLVTCVLLTACPQQRVLENQGLINTRGIDVDGDDKIKANFVMFQFEEQAKELTKVISGTGKTATDALKSANYEANYLVEVGNIKMDLYGVEIAKKGIAPHLDMLNRNTDTSDTMYLALSKTTAEDVINLPEEDLGMNIGQYLYNLIEGTSTKSATIFPKEDLQRFMFFYKSVGMDPVLPMFEIVNEKPKITAIGVFQNDKYVGELSIENDILLNFNIGRMKEQAFHISVPTDSLKERLSDNPMEKEVGGTIDLSFSINKSHSNIKLLNKQSLEYEHTIDIQAELVDSSAYDNLNIEDKVVLDKLEKEVENGIQHKYEKLLNELQQFNADPLGYGEIYRQNSRESRLTEKKWRKLFPDINVKYTIDFQMIQHGETF